MIIIRMNNKEKTLFFLHSVHYLVCLYGRTQAKNEIHLVAVPCQFSTGRISGVYPHICSKPIRVFIIIFLICIGFIQRSHTQRARPHTRTFNRHILIFAGPRVPINIKLIAFYFAFELNNKYCYPKLHSSSLFMRSGRG